MHNNVDNNEKHANSGNKRPPVRIALEVQARSSGYRTHLLSGVSADAELAAIQDVDAGRAEAPICTSED